MQKCPRIWQIGKENQLIKYQQELNKMSIDYKSPIVVSYLYIATIPFVHASLAI